MFLKAHWEVLAAIDFTTRRSLDQGRSGDLLPAVCDGTETRLHFAGCTVNGIGATTG